MSFMKDFDHLQIQMKDIVSATDNFDPAKMIGRGGFGRVYRGELSLAEGQIMVAFKRLDRRLGQGTIEFWREIMMLSKYKHENLISLMHYCMEGDEMILVYEYASRGSLDRYLSDASTLTWIQRLRICVGAARGLHFLHDPMETQQRVLHRDIKSTNILLDEKWTAKVSDFGLSKLGPANQEHSYLISNAVGTPGYCDPLYWELGFLSKESDVYSFGVVLFEILCGRLCCEYHNGKLHSILVPKWRQCYEKNLLDEIILDGLKEQMVLGSLNSFSAIAYQCVNRAREERPSMAEILKELEYSLEQQDILEILKKKVHITELMKITDLAVPPVSYGQSQMLMLLLKGLFVDDGTWVSINMNGEITKVVPATKCFFGDKVETKNADTAPMPDTAIYSRCKFAQYLWKVYSNRFRVEVNTHFLSPNVTYTIYIVFQHCGYFSAPCYIPFKYKLDEETHYCTSCIAYKNYSTWVMTKLYRFTSYHGQPNINIEFLPPDHIPFIDALAFQGIEIRPMWNDEDAYEKRKGKNKIYSDLETKLARDFSYFIKLSKGVINWTTNKELHFLLRKGFLIDGEKWFSISKNMKKRLMIPASRFLGQEEWTFNSIPDSESRFQVVTKSVIGYSFTINLTRAMIEPFPKAACHLIYKLSDDYSSFKGPMVIGIVDCTRNYVVPLSICLNPRCHPPIIGPKDDQIEIPCKMKGHAKRRKDGWMEVQFAEDSMGDEQLILSVEEEKFRSMNFFGIVIQGIEFRPCL